MIWLICRAEWAIASIASTASPTISELFFASSSATATAARACAAPSAAVLTVPAISSTAVVVSSRLEACCSLRADNSSAALAMSWAPPRMTTTPAITVRIARSSWAIAALKSVFNSP